MFKITNRPKPGSGFGSGVQGSCVHVFRCLGVWVFFRCSRAHDNSEDQKGDSQNGQNIGRGKNSRFWASSSAKKVLLTAEKWGSAQN